ncbi:MAG: hypothetical protein D6683_15170 [Actinomyces sp.]|nr:MAG: hypothetical protein D6683_15170 [Actinomyces sp.]
MTRRPWTPPSPHRPPPPPAPSGAPPPDGRSRGRSPARSSPRSGPVSPWRRPCPPGAGGPWRWRAWPAGTS